MSRDNKLFQEALKRGSAHAWNEQWDNAAREYRLALQEFPEDVSARTYLAMALYKSGEYRESLVLYQSLWNAQPSNLTMLKRVAELQEAIGNREAAATSYGQLADAHTRQRSPKDAFKAWQKVVDLTPGNPPLWNSLVEMAIQAGTVKEVIPGYLGLARDLALRSRFQEAVQIVERAEKLDPGNPLAVALLLGIRRAMQYWWRAAGLREQVFPEDLERLIPHLQVTDSPLPAIEDGPVSPLHSEEPPTRYRRDEDRPTITVYADNVTLAVNKSGHLSIHGGDAPDAQPPAMQTEEVLGEVSWEEFEAEATLPPAPRAALPPAPEAGVRAIEDEEAPAVVDLEGHEPAGDPEEAADESPVAEVPEIGLIPEASFELPSEFPEVPDDASDLTEEAPTELSFAELTWEEFEAMTSQPAAEPESPASEEAAVTAEDLEPVEAVSPETVPTDGEIEVLADLEPIDVPPGLEAATAAAELEGQAPSEPEEEQPEAEVAQPEPAAAEASPEVEFPLVFEPEAAEEDTVAEEAPEELAPEDSTVGSWHELMREAAVARSSGKLREAIDLYEQSLAAGAAVAQQYLELGEVHEQLGERDEAARAFAQALDLTPNKPEALVGLARIDLFNHQLDSAERVARRALEAVAPDAPELAVWVVDLMLDVLRERAAYGDLGAVAEGLVWLQSSPAATRFYDVQERIASTPRAMLGRAVAEHLEEIGALPKQARGEVTVALSKSEENIEAGKLRSAADEMYRVVIAHPDFLPAHSVLGRVLVAQGRLSEAAARAQRLIDLYELRGRQDEALEVLLWMVRANLGTPEGIKCLAESLRSRNRIDEAEAITREASPRRNGAAVVPQVVATPIEPAAPVVEAPPVEEIPPTPEPMTIDLESGAGAPPVEEPVAPITEMPRPEDRPQEGAQPAQETVAESSEADHPRDDKPKRGFRGMFKALRGAIQRDAGEEKPAEPEIPPGMEILSSDVAARDGLLRLAESKFAFGDAKGAASLIQAALQDERISDVATRAALLRVLQLTAPANGHRDALAGTLSELGLPEELAD